MDGQTQGAGRQRQAGLLDIRRGMDVYDTDQAAYIGAVVGLITAPASTPPAASRNATPARTAAAEPAARGAPKLAHEAARAAPPVMVLGRRVLGEELGPFPTIAAGNRGPLNQSAARLYATEVRGEPANVRGIVVRPGRLNPLARPLYIPVQAIRSIAIDRLILAVRAADLPAGWRRREAAMEEEGGR